MTAQNEKVPGLNEAEEDEAEEEDMDDADSAEVVDQQQEESGDQIQLGLQSLGSTTSLVELGENDGATGDKLDFDGALLSPLVNPAKSAAASPPSNQCVAAATPLTPPAAHLLAHRVCDQVVLDFASLPALSWN